MGITMNKINKRTFEGYAKAFIEKEFVNQASAAVTYGCSASSLSQALNGTPHKPLPIMLLDAMGAEKVVIKKTTISYRWKK